MDTSIRGNKKGNRLHNGKPEIRKLFRKGARPREFKGNPEQQRQREAVKLEIFLRVCNQYITTPKQDKGN